MPYFPHTSAPPKWAMIDCGLVVLYVLSIGPAVATANRHPELAPPLRVVYLPLDWMPAFFYPLVYAYIGSVLKLTDTAPVVGVIMWSPSEFFGSHK